jgi:hypothetical protein
MGKWAKLATIKTTSLNNFVYMPPDNAMKAARILVLANLGYAMGAPSALNWGTLSAVLRGLRRGSPRARIMITDKICPISVAEVVFEKIGLASAIDDEMRVVPSDVLLKRDYANPLPQPLNHAFFVAPEAIADFDCVVNVGVFEAHNGMVKGAVNALYHFLPCEYPLQIPNTPQRHHDIFFTFAPHIDESLLEVRLGRDDIRVMSGADMLLLDEAACRLTHTALPDYIEAIEATRKSSV